MPWPPIYTGSLAGIPIRFFRAPGDKQDFPYHAVDDLHAALKLPRALRRELRSGLSKGHWRSDVKVAVYAGERVLIGPHFMAQGLIWASVKQGQAPSGVELEYRLLGSEAFSTDCTARGLSAAQAVDRAFLCATGRSHIRLARMVNTETGEVSINLADAQAALGLNDEELQNSIDQMQALGCPPKLIATSKLARLQ